MSKKKKPNRVVQYYALFDKDGVKLSKWDTRKDKLVRIMRELKRNQAVGSVFCRRRTFLKPLPVSVQAEPAQNALL